MSPQPARRSHQHNRFNGYGKTHDQWPAKKRKPFPNAKRAGAREKAPALFAFRLFSTPIRPVRIQPAARLESRQKCRDSGSPEHPISGRLATDFLCRIRTFCARRRLFVQDADFLCKATWNPLFRAAMILSGSAVHLNGLASRLLCSAMKRSMAASHAATELKSAPRRRRFVNFAKNPSTAFNHDDDVGMK